MESLKAKRHKLCKDSIAATSTDSLTSICDWSKPTATAIKHHENVRPSTEVTYAELAVAKLSVTQILGDAQTSLFIGIASDIPSYCLPGLMLGIMSGGLAFVCLPSSSQEAQKICESLRISHIFSSKNAAELEVASDVRIHRINLLLLRAKNPRLDSIEPTTKQKSFAYAITTSGSTGDPKIVRVTHRSIVPNILDLKRILRLSESETIAQLTPTTFDPSMVEIFLSLSCGGSLFTVSQEIKNDPETLLKLIVKSRVSVLQSTPSLLLHRWSSKQLRRTILGGNSDLRILMLGGENLPSEKVLARMKAPENRTRIFDLYGITEISCWASVREILPHDDGTRILGEALSETIFEVRDEAGKFVEEGEGIIHIGSNSRICAIDDEEITRLKAPVFRDTGDTVAVDRNGLMTLRGRSGRTVKRYGTRLNLAKLESHVLQLPSVENCCALFTQHNQSLHLFFTTPDRSLNETNKLELETSVLNHATKLPDVYRPDKVSLLDRFELTPNGKICRKFLQKCSVKISRLSSSGKIKEEIEIDEIFANIWKRSLPIDGASGFLDLGGTSVMALRIVTELVEESRRDYPELVGRLLRNKSLASCRSYISRHALKLSKTVADEAGIEGAFVNSESKIDREFSRGGKEPITEMSKNVTNADIAWQKCRGKSSFPPEIEGKQRDWLNVEEIRPWKVYKLGKCVDASPTVFAYPGGKDYVTVGSHSGVICTAELSNEKCPDHWEIALPDRVEASVLVLTEFRAVVGSYDGYVYCVHLKTGDIFWKFKTGDAVKCTAVLSSRGRNVFFGSYDRHVYCVSVENGSKVWKAGAGGGSICATPCVHNELDSVLFATLDGTCASLRQSSGEVIWLNKLDYPIFSAPVVLESGIAIFCDVSGKLNGFYASTGEKAWAVEIDGTVFSHLVAITEPTTKHQSLLFASKNQKVYRLDCSSREKAPVIQLEKDLGAPVFSTPWSNGRVIAIVGTDGELKLLDFVTGKLLNSHKLGGDVFSSPIIHEDFIVVGCRDNNLYVLTCADCSDFDQQTELSCT